MSFLLNGADSVDLASACVQVGLNLHDRRTPTATPRRRTTMTDAQVGDFAARYPDAAMITIRADGATHMARVELAVLDGQLWATGSAKLVRTRNLRRDPRCSLFVFGPHPHWLGLETKATILDGPDTPS